MSSNAATATPDPIGRLAAEVLQRALEAALDRDPVDETFEHVVLDHVLVGRGVPWVRFDARVDDDEVSGESAPVEYVHWSDFAHSAHARTWAENRKTGFVARQVRMTLARGVKRFGEKFRMVPLDARIDSSDVEETTEQWAARTQHGAVWEIWCADSRTVKWVAKGLAELLDERPDPLGLEGFFPCPRPAYGTHSTRSLIPVPDFLQYQKLADQLDDITDRIHDLVGEIRVRGIYDSTMTHLASLLSDASADKMYPVDGMTEYLGKGSQGSTITGVVQFLPIEMFAAALAQLYQAREVAKQQLFEISGISDIVRGQVQNRYERLGQSELKGDFATRRIGAKRREIDRALRDCLAMKAEIMVEHFDPATLRAMAGFDLMAPIVALHSRDPERADKIIGRVWERIAALLRDERTRGFRIDIETDSTIAANEGEEVERRIAFLESAGAFFERSLPIVQAFPRLAPLVGDMTLFAVRSFRAGRSLEASFEDAVRTLTEAAEAPPPEAQGPSPEEVRAQAEAQKMQIAGAKGRQDLQIQAAKAQIALGAEERRAQVEAEAALLQAEIDAVTSMQELEVKAAEIELKREALETKRRELALQAARDASRDDGAGR